MVFQCESSNDASYYILSGSDPSEEYANNPELTLPEYVRLALALDGMGQDVKQHSCMRKSTNYSTLNCEAFEDILRKDDIESEVIDVPCSQRIFDTSGKQLN